MEVEAALSDSVAIHVYAKSNTVTVYEQAEKQSLSSFIGAVGGALGEGERRSHCFWTPPL